MDLAGNKSVGALTRRFYGYMQPLQTYVTPKPALNPGHRLSRRQKFVEFYYPSIVCAVNDMK